MADHPVATPAKELTPEESEARHEWAFAAHRRIVEKLGNLRNAGWDLAEDLFEFDLRGGWIDLGYETLTHWLADPEITMTTGTFYRLRDGWKELVVVKQIEPARVRQLDTTKVEVVLPALRRTADPRKVKRILSDVEALGRRDLSEKYPRKAPASDDSAGGGSEPSSDVIDAEATPISENGAEAISEPEDGSETPFLEDGLPAALGLCPVHFGEFYMPLSDGESRHCPEPGCDRDMVVYTRETQGGSDEHA